MPQCTATSKRTGDRCRGNAITGRNVCYYHGGRTPRGRDCANFKTGLYSRDLPTRLAARYNAARNDPDLKRVDDDLALLSTRLAEVLLKLDTGEAGAIWAALRRVHADLRVARSQGYEDALNDGLTQIGALIERGAADYQQWSEIARLAEQRRKLLETDAKLMLVQQQYITAEQLMLIGGNLQRAVYENVTDPNTLAAIGRAFAAIMGYTNIRALPVGD